MTLDEGEGRDCWVEKKLVPQFSHCCGARKDPLVAAFVDMSLGIYPA